MSRALGSLNGGTASPSPSKATMVPRRGTISNRLLRTMLAPACHPRSSLPFDSTPLDFAMGGPPVQSGIEFRQQATGNWQQAKTPHRLPVACSLLPAPCKSFDSPGAQKYVYQAGAGGDWERSAGTFDVGCSPTFLFSVSPFVPPADPLSIPGSSGGSGATPAPNV